MPRRSHWLAVKRIVRYLKGTQDFGIKYSHSEDGQLVGYSDADFAGDVCDRKSTTGYIFYLSYGPISWKSKKQSVVAASTCESESISLAACAQEAIWLRNILTDFEPEMPTTLYEDNQPVIALTKNAMFHPRTKHINVKFHFIREGQLIVQYVSSNHQLADMLTKALPTVDFIKNKKINLRYTPTLNLEEVLSVKSRLADTTIDVMFRDKSKLSISLS